MAEKETAKCIDCKIDELIRNNYRPVDDKPGYVWFDPRLR